MEPGCHSDQRCSDIKHTHLLLRRRNETWDPSAASDTSCWYPFLRKINTEEVLHLFCCCCVFTMLCLSECWLLLLLHFFHESESVRKCTYTDGERGWGGEGMGEGGLQFCALLWLVTTPLPSRWAWATGWLCVCLHVRVCVCVQSCPLPPLHCSFQTSQCHRPGCQGNLLCWWVHLCVNHYLATT